MNKIMGKEETRRSDFGQVLNLEREISALEQSIASAKKELEHQQAALMAAKQEEAEAKSLTKSLLDEAEKTETELGRKKDGLERQCADLDEKSRQAERDLDVKSKKLKEVNEQLAAAKKQLNGSRWEWRRRLLPTVAYILVFFAVISVFMNDRRKISELNEEISEWKDTCQNATKEKADALAKVYELKGYTGPVVVRVNHLYNADEKGSKISDDLIPSEMRYLYYDFDVLFLEDTMKETDIYVDLYYPDGSLDRSSSSPDGHTTHYNVRESGNVVGGWGNSSKSNYKAGVYRMDFVYEDVIIHSQKIEISDSAQIKLR